MLSSSLNKDLPQIKEGDPCTPGQSYKMDCNRCHCSAAKKLLCTKRTCVDWSNFINHKSKLRQAKKPTTNQRLRAGKAIHNNKQSLLNRKPKRSTKPTAKQGQFDLPLLPKGKCFPGRIYRKKCRRCFCNDLGESLCSANENAACKLLENGYPVPVRVPEDIRPVFERDELKQDIPTLPSASEKCEPGMTYRVSCNNCVCTERNNLICTRSLCLSFDDINRIEANERTGKKCVGTKVTKESCIECQCISEKLSCKSIPDCYTDTRTRLSKGTNGTLKMQIDPIRDKCIPGAVYRDNCNHCYCQPDASLRCTQKTCLNYAQAKILTDQFKKLETEAL